MEALLFPDIIKLLFSAVLGIAFGLEREIKKKPLGLKTCLTISVSSCLVTMVSFQSAANFTLLYHFVDADPTRITAQIVSGVGFLGAGVIMRKDNRTIEGLTTAAIVWSAAGLGIAVATGFYIEATVSALLILLSVEFLPKLLRKLGPHTFKEKSVAISMGLKKEIYCNFEQEFKDMGFHTDKIKLMKKDEHVSIEMHSFVDASWDAKKMTDVIEARFDCSYVQIEI